MILPRPEEALHKAVMYRLLIGLLDEKEIAPNVLFKGGSCASMLGWLDRFSIDLDFDLKRGAEKTALREKLLLVFENLNFKIKEQAKESLFFVLKYEAPSGKRNALKLSIFDDPPRANQYEVFYLGEIDRFAQCQTRETMFANKLVSVLDRYEKYQTIAGRDVYDIHYFFGQGFDYDQKVIGERRGVKTQEYLEQLIEFIQKRITSTIINEDLNSLLTPEKFKQVRLTLKEEVLIYLRNELERF